MKALPLAASAAFLLCLGVPALHADDAAAPATDSRQALKAEAQPVRADLHQLRTQKADLREQLMSINSAKWGSSLQTRLDKLNAKLQAAQAANKTGQVTAIQQRIAVLQKEQGIQKNVADLEGKLQTAQASGDTATAKALMGQIKDQREQAKAARTALPQGKHSGAAKAPATVDPQVQALKDQIKAVDGKIDADKNKLKDLRAQRQALKK